MKKLFLICFTAITAVAIATSGSATKQNFSSPILKSTIDTVPRGNRMDSSNRWKNNGNNRKGKMHHNADSSMDKTDNGAINSNSNNGSNSGNGDSSANRPPR